jgi:KaiC/GvpD/RAD55 family RecA-like ATPase
MGRPPSILEREDGTCLLYRGKLHSLYGEPEAGKGWVALKAATDQLAAGEHVVYIDFEDDAETAVERLRALGAKPKAIRDRIRYLRSDEPLSEAGKADLEAALEPAPSLVVLDGMTEALALEGLDLNSNADVAQWIVGLPRCIAVESAAAVLIIDHVVGVERNYLPRPMEVLRTPGRGGRAVVGGDVALEA